MIDDFGVHGTWKLEGFPDAVHAWQRDERPPPRLVHDVDGWWPRLEHASERVRAHRLDQDDDLYVMWVPKCYVLDDVRGLQGVLCYFRQQETGHRVVCEAFHLAFERRPPEGFGV